MWWTKAQFKSYEDVAKFYHGCRNPIRGKPYKKWGRILVIPEGFELAAYGVIFARITPNNRLTFVISADEAKASIAITLNTCLYRMFPLMWERVGKARYKVIHVSQTKTSGTHLNWKQLRIDAPEYFEGITFDLATGECVNAKPNIKENLIPEVRIQWIRGLRAFKIKAKAMIRLGLFNREVVKPASNVCYFNPSKAFCDGVRNGVVSSELINYFLRKYHNRYNMYDEFDRFCSDHSLQARKLFGVFGQAYKEES